MRVVQGFEDGNLVVERIHLLGRHRLFLDDLNCSDNSAFSSDALANLAVRALGYQFPDLVGVLELSNVLLYEILLANLNFIGISDDLLLYFVHFRFRV